MPTSNLAATVECAILTLFVPTTTLLMLSGIYLRNFISEKSFWSNLHDLFKYNTFIILVIYVGGWSPCRPEAIKSILWVTLFLNDFVFFHFILNFIFATVILLKILWNFMKFPCHKKWFLEAYSQLFIHCWEFSKLIKKLRFFFGSVPPNKFFFRYDSKHGKNSFGKLF